MSEYVHTMLCGKINLTEEVDGLEVVRAHPLQLEPGVCAHTDGAQWAARTADVQGEYAGLIGDDEWPVHAWVKPVKINYARAEKVPEPQGVAAARRELFERLALEPVQLPAPCPMTMGSYDRPVGILRPETRETPWTVAEGPEYWHKDTKLGVWFRVTAPEQTQPAPELLGSWRAEMPEIAPAPVLQLAELAREASWDVRVSYARGNGIHGSTSRPTGLRHVISVAFGRHPVRQEQGVATYVRAVSGSTWSWESVWLWGPGLKHFGLCGLADLKVWLADGLDLEKVRARVEGAENLKAQVKLRNAKIKERAKAGEDVRALALEFELLVADVIKIITPAKAKRESGG